MSGFWPVIDCTAFSVMRVNSGSNLGSLCTCDLCAYCACIVSVKGWTTKTFLPSNAKVHGSLSQPHAGFNSSKSINVALDNLSRKYPSSLHQDPNTSSRGMALIISSPNLSNCSMLGEKKPAL